MEIKKTLTAKYREEGGIMPRWYGAAYRDFYTNTTVCYPIPLNLFVIVGRWVRWLWYKAVKFGGFGGRWNRQVNARDVLLELADDIVNHYDDISSPECRRDIAFSITTIARRCLP